MSPLGIGRRRGTSGRTTVKTDNFNRADGALGANWTAGAEGGLTIASNVAVGTSAALKDSMRTAESYGNDHYSEIQVTASALASGDFIGPAVRMQNTGNNEYAVLYFNNPSALGYMISLYKRIGGGSYTQIDPNPVSSGFQGYALPGALVAGDKIRLSVAGSQLTVSINGKRVTRVIDASIASGGAPGFVSFGLGRADNWMADVAKAELAAPVTTFTSSPPNSSRNGAGHNCRVLAPRTPAAGVPHNFLYTLMTGPDGDFTYGDPLDALYGLDFHNQYNLTCIAANFDIGSHAPGSGYGPWYIDTSNPGAFPSFQHETYMVSDLVPWVTSNLAISGTEKHWLIGFSKSGWGGLNLLLRHPTVFDRGAFWDFPYSGTGTVITSSYGMDGNYGNAAYVDGFTFTSAYLDTYKAPFQARKRIWIGGHQSFASDITAAHTAFNGKSMLHDQQTDRTREHEWQSGWLPDALASLAAMT